MNKLKGEEIMTDYEKTFESLGIPIGELPKNYTPDEFAKEMLKDFPKPSGVSYSTQTNINTNSK